MGIADAIKARVVRPETNIVSELVAKGEIELGIVVITQIMTTRGVELVGPIPDGAVWSVSTLQRKRLPRN
jgi:hypothetical protein